MEKISELTEKIKILKQAREILKDEYKQSEFHKKKEASPQDLVPPSPEDKEIYRLLTAIQQLDFYIKKLQDEQFELLKKVK
jgi:curved DNA-binding protein CbpA